MFAAAASDSTCLAYSCAVIASTVLIVLIFLSRTSREVRGRTSSADHLQGVASVQHTLLHDACIVTLAIMIVVFEVFVAQSC